MKKFAFCRVSISPLRAENKDSSEMVSQMLFGEPIEILEINQKWTKVITYYDHYEGWMDTYHFIAISEKELKRSLECLDFMTFPSINLETPWGKQIVLKGSYIDSSSSTFQIGNNSFSYSENISKTENWKSFALSYLNAPYLWGGKSPFGIDCSGFTQSVLKSRGINLPRDAYQQAELGLEIPFEEQEAGDLAFFVNDLGKINHVGLILENHQIIHASSWVRIDTLKTDGIYKEGGIKSHSLLFIKRY